MNRRKFYKNALGALAATTLTASPLSAKNEAHRLKNFPRRIIKPPRLKIGANIGLIAPSSPIPLNRWQQTIKNLEGMGFNLFYDEKAVLSKYGYLAGSDELRAEEVNRMFADKNIDGIWCVRGGYGSARILDQLDYKMIKRNPKVLIGYSDITALLHGIFRKTGLVCFHGPVGTSTYSKYTIKNVTNVLMSSKDSYKIELPPENLTELDSAYAPLVINNGIATGRLIGGNLTLVSSLMGTPYQLNMKGKLIFLEDIGEKPYRLDRMLTQLLISGELQKAAGIILGVFIDCEAGKNDNSLSLREMFKDRLGHLDIPVIYGLSFGHISNNFTIPMGINARLNTNDKSLTLLENAVKT